MGVALEGIRVIDATQAAAAPMAARFLADWGADVIHIEHPVRAELLRAFQTTTVGGFSQPSNIKYAWENYNRNKRGMTLDYSKEPGKEIIYKLVQGADVFITSFRQREVQKFGLQYGTLSKLNPRLIYASLSGYGNVGPDKDMPGFDWTAFWARSGIMHMLTEDGTVPPGCRPAMGDNVSGLALACGILAALFVRQRTGIGQEVEASLFATGIFTLSYDIAGALATGRDWHQLARRDNVNPMTTHYETRDGRWLLLCFVQPDLYWSKFCNAIGREELEHDPRLDSFESRAKNHEALYDILVEIFHNKTLDEWKARLDDADVPWSPVCNLKDVITSPQARANDLFVTFDHPTFGPMEVAACPIKLSKTPASVRKPAPEFGQHTEEVLLELGYTWNDIEQLKENGVIA